MDGTEATLNVRAHAIPDAQRRTVDKVAEILFTNLHKTSESTENHKVNRLNLREL